MNEEAVNAFRAFIEENNLPIVTYYDASAEGEDFDRVDD